MSNIKNILFSLLIYIIYLIQCKKMNNQNNLRKNSEPDETEIEDLIEEENVYELRKNTNYIHI